MRKACPDTRQPATPFLDCKPRDQSRHSCGREFTHQLAKQPAFTHCGRLRQKTLCSSFPLLIKEPHTQADPGLSKAELRAGIAHWRLGNLEAAVRRVETACGMPGASPEADATRKELAAFQDRKAKASPWLSAQIAEGHAIIAAQYESLVSATFQWAASCV